MTPVINSLFLVVKLIAGVIAIVLLAELADALFKLKRSHKFGLVFFLYLGLVAILLRA
jgi:F0F1-type ATP synthase assembly protein I